MEFGNPLVILQAYVDIPVSYLHHMLEKGLRGGGRGYGVHVVGDGSEIIAHIDAKREPGILSGKSEIGHVDAAGALVFHRAVLYLVAEGVSH